MSSASNDFGRDHGLIHEAIVTGRKAGWGAEEWAKLAHSEKIMRQIVRVLRGQAAITDLECLIDCDALPFVPEGWKVVEHQKGGPFNWDASQVVLHLDDDQKSGKVVEGSKLLAKLAKAIKQGDLLNANVLDFLLANPHLIPEEWKGKAVFFWGTVYRDRSGDLCVRCLFWHGGRWYWGNRWLVYGRDGNNPAAVRAS